MGQQMEMMGPGFSKFTREFLAAALVVIFAAFILILVAASRVT